MDISPAYPTDELKSLQRSFKAEASGITMCDEFDYVGDGDIVERFVTLHKPKIGDCIVEIADAVLHFAPEVAAHTINTEELKNDVICYIIDFKPPKGTRKFTILV